MAAGKHNAAAVVHGLRAWRLLLLPSIIGERAPALSTLDWYQLLSSGGVGLTSRLDCTDRTLAPSTAEGVLSRLGVQRTDCRRRHRYRGAELGRIDPFISQFTATYAWTTP